MNDGTGGPVDPADTALLDRLRPLVEETTRSRRR